MAKPKKYYVLYKPAGYLSQFSPEHGKKCLSDLVDVPKDVYPVGRLDEMSEGMLLLTNDKNVNQQLLDPTNNHERTYLVQVEGQLNKKAIKQLKKGVEISLPDGPYTTKPAKAQKTGNPKLPDREPPVSFDKSKGVTWLKLVLTEGKNRQVRRMTAAVGFPTVRLVRTGIENLDLGPLNPGELQKLDRPTFYDKLNLL
jgi:23S rRNA pseudouridine2457 synthase